MIGELTAAQRDYLDAFVELEESAPSPASEGGRDDGREAGWERLDAALRDDEPSSVDLVVPPRPRRGRAVGLLALAAAVAAGAVWLGRPELARHRPVQVVHELAPHVGALRGASSTTHAPPVASDSPRTHAVRIRVVQREAPGPPPSAIVPATVPAPRRRRVRPASSVDPEQVVPREVLAPDLDPEEVWLVQSARTAAKRGRDGEALELLEQYRRRFPKGILAPEAGAAWLVLRCKRGRVTHSDVRAFMRSRPAAYLRRQVQAVCDERSFDRETESSSSEH